MIDADMLTESYRRFVEIAQSSRDVSDIPITTAASTLGFEVEQLEGWLVALHLVLAEQGMYDPRNYLAGFLAGLQVGAIAARLDGAHAAS